MLTRPALTAIKQRYSCRHYLTTPIDEDRQQQLAEFLAHNTAGPLGATARFRFLAATAEDGRALRGLGTYGMIRNPTGFLVGAVPEGEKNLEGFGFLMERAVLFATELGLGTCWLGGFFTRSSFARAIAPTGGETVPAVVAVGIPAAAGNVDLVRQFAKGHSRLPWDKLFFQSNLGSPLPVEAAGPYATALEMVRLAPSASNHQPWRIVAAGRDWHFYLQRTPRYLNNSITKLLGIADLQRVDLGIAMCHWELACQEVGLAGEWQARDPGIGAPGDALEYVASWPAA
jgi:nitroreductase